jgi:DNA-binding MarR family transcriptional regulator/Fe2+ or Zn2+ uptake regulation protein
MVISSDTPQGLLTKSGAGLRSVRSSELRERIMTLLADGKPWRSKHLVERVAEGPKPATVRRALEVLREAGRITKHRPAVWTLAGIPEPSADAIPPLGAERRGGATGRKLLVLLSGPGSVFTLARELGVSRQRVDQILKNLLEQGKAVRIPEPGAVGRWLWMRSDASAEEFLRHYVPALPAGQAKVLNALEPDAFHWVGDVAATTGQSTSGVSKQLQELEEKGLSVRLRLGRKRYCGMTPRGLDHRSRMPSAARSVVADLSKACCQRLVAFLETLAVLSEAKTVDVTAALAGSERPGTELLSGQLMARLIRSDFAEPVAGKSGARPAYRLTETGRRAAALIARNRKPPGREQIEYRIASYQNRLRETGMRPGRTYDAGAASPAQQAILDALVAGPLPTTALRGVVGRHASNPKSVHLMLRNLAKRGVVQKVGLDGRVNVWSLSQQASA